MGVATAVAIVGATAAVAGVIVAKTSADRAADLQTEQGNAVAGAAREQLNFQKQLAREQQAERLRVEKEGVALALRYSKKSPDEMAATKRLLETKEQALNRGLEALNKEYDIYDTMEPTIKEAGQQTLALLRGERARILDPMMKQRDSQRQQLEEQLAQKLGPGFRTSSAGIEALGKFDDGSAALMAGAQSQALQQVAGIFQSTAASRPDLVGKTGSIFEQAAGIDKAVLANESNVTTRTLQGVLQGFKQTPVDFGGVYQASGNVTNSAGAPYQGAINGAQSNANLGGTLLNMGANVGGNVFSQYMFQDMFKPPAVVSGTQGASYAADKASLDAWSWGGNK